MIAADSKIFTRARDLAYLAGRIVDCECCAIVGVSNIGKSNLLRQLRTPNLLTEICASINEDTTSFFYVDFNLQLQMTGQGFYELVLRTVLTNLRQHQADPALLGVLEEAYQQIISPTDEFQNALSFNQAIIALCEQWPRRVVFLFDEFDEVFQQLDARVFLNLRALRDKYPGNLIYVVSVGAVLSSGRNETEIAEFSELFTHHTYFLQALEEADVQRAIKNFTVANDTRFSDEDIHFITEQSGGHPGLLQLVCQIFAHNTHNGVARDFRRVSGQLADNPNVRTECVKLWHSLLPDNRASLFDFMTLGQIDTRARRVLLQRGILTAKDDGQLAVFGRLFEDFVRRQRLVQAKPQKDIFLDVDSGQVFVNGKQTELLTNLEYRLLLLLYGQADKICDKYRIVEAVWGEDYIEEVDDARIEKLVSRLRQKIEPTPSEPHFLLTVRGRGYRLQVR